ncbi:MAG: Gfo/Idh/MocA family oxidoreductase [Chloroflexota bacterium]
MLNWGIIGTSFISDTLAEAIGNDPEAQVVAVAGRRPEALAEFQEKYEIARTYLDYDAFLADETVDVIYIALPNHLHHSYVVKAAAAGKHILCEKSLSIDMPKTEEALAAVAKQGVFFMEGLMYLVHPLLAKLVGLLQAQAVGSIRTISGQYCADIAQFVNPGSKGAIYNLGCYPASLLHLVLQTAFGAEAFSAYQLAAFGNLSSYDGNVCDTLVQLRFANGVLAQLHCAEDYGETAVFTITGDAGEIRFVSNPWLPTATDNIIELNRYGQGVERIEVSAKGDAFFYEVRLVRDCIERGLLEAPRPAPRQSDSHEIMELLTRWETAVLASY